MKSKMKHNVEYRIHLRESATMFEHYHRCGGLVVSADSGSSGPGSGPGWGHCVVFLGKTLYSHGASLHPRYQ